MDEWRIFRRGGRPAEIPIGEINHCWENALNVIRDFNVEYAEGWAWPANEEGPCAHAWVVDKQGLALDVTWPEPGLLYIGRVLSFDDVQRALRNDPIIGSPERRAEIRAAVCTFIPLHVAEIEKALGPGQADAESWATIESSGRA